jgi:hypothetical protein
MWTLAGIAFQAACAFGPIIGGYRSIAIDPATLRVDLQNPVAVEFDGNGKGKAIQGSYYQVFTGQGGGTSIDHYFQNDLEKPRIRYNHLEMGADRILAKTTNAREVLRGPFGTVYSRKDCYYNLPIENYYNSVEVRLYANEMEHEPATVSNERPFAATGTLTYVNVIRVLRGGPEYLVLSALYSATGHLKRASVDGARAGDWVHSAYVEEARRDTVFIRASGPTQAEVAVMTRYGLPEAISVENALQHRLVGLEPPANASVERDVITLFYDHDRWMVQDEYLTSGAHHTRYLTYSETTEGSVLDSRCRERFREASAKGLAGAF